MTVRLWDSGQNETLGFLELGQLAVVVDKEYKGNTSNYIEVLTFDGRHGWVLDSMVEVFRHTTKNSE